MISTKKESLRPRSKKRAKEYAEYQKVREQFLKDNPICAVHKQWGCEAQEVHHMCGKIGSLLNDTRYFLPVCRAAHIEIESAPKWAKEHGYSISRLGNI